MKKLLYSIMLVFVCGIALGIYLIRWNPLDPLQSGVVVVDSIQREFCYHVPDGVTLHPKLIFVLHGSGSTGKMMREATGHEFDKFSDESKNVIVVYPDAYHKLWNECRKEGKYESKMLNINDDTFFEQMINYFYNQYHIDKGTVFATGFSGGGQMCYRLAKEKPGLFKGFAAANANLPVATNNDCFESRQPVSMLVMNGTSDPINPYNGGEVTLGKNEKRGVVMSTAQTIQYWAGLGKCDTTQGTTYAYPDINKSDNSTAEKYDYTCATTGKEVVLVEVINGGHIFPNPSFSLWPPELGNVNKDIDAPKIIFDYFMGLK